MRSKHTMAGWVIGRQALVQPVDPKHGRREAARSPGRSPEAVMLRSHIQIHRRRFCSGRWRRKNPDPCPCPSIAFKANFTASSPPLPSMIRSPVLSCLVLPCLIPLSPSLPLPSVTLLVLNQNESIVRAFQSKLSHTTAPVPTLRASDPDSAYNFNPPPPPLPLPPPIHSASLPAGKLVLLALSFAKARTYRVDLDKTLRLSKATVPAIAGYFNLNHRLRVYCVLLDTTSNISTP